MELPVEVVSRLVGTVDGHLGTVPHRVGVNPYHVETVAGPVGTVPYRVGIAD